MRRIRGGGRCRGDGRGGASSLGARRRPRLLCGREHADGDAPLDEITETAFDRIATINLRGAIMTCKHALPQQVAIQNAVRL